jgi:methyl-accepting chemotaxis protein
MKNLSLGQRIAFGFAAIIVLTLVFGLVSLNRFMAVSASGRYLGSDPIPGTVAILRIEHDVMGSIGLMREYVYTADRPKIAAEINQQRADLDRSIAAYDATISDPVDRAKFEEFKKTLAELRTTLAEVMRRVDSGQTADISQYIDSKVEGVQDSVDSTVTWLVEFNEGNLKRGVAEIESYSSLGQRILVGGLTLAVLGALLIAYFITRSINRALTSIATTLAAGADQTAAAAGQVSGSAQSLAEGASEQAASLEETSASLEELSSMTKRNADSANQAKQLAGETRAAADTGAAEMQSMRTAMEAIKQSSGEIAKIVKTIDEIAFQTNILALNAAVEAARAGNAGAGFAVVAEEVRALAQRSAAAAQESSSKIEDSVNRSQHAVHITGRVAEALDQIVGRARQVDTLVGEIAVASQEQSQGIHQVTSAASQMDKITQANASSAEESAAAAEELSAQSSELQRTVAELNQLVGGRRTATGAPSPVVTPKLKRAVTRASVTPAPVKTLRAAPAPTSPRALAEVSSSNDDQFFTNP